MWVTVTFAYLIPALVVTARLLSGERRHAVGLWSARWQTVLLPALEIGPAARPPLIGDVRRAVPDFWTLTKPEVNFLIVIATFTGFYLGCPSNLHPFPLARLLNTLLGTLLVASGTGTLNQYLEHRFDARMRRTCSGPLPRQDTARARCWFGICAFGNWRRFTSLVAVNALASVLACLTLASYLFVYTPLKRKTPLCTLVGAFPGAMPPLIGWAAASGSIISGKAWILYAVLFLWQFPHFMAIAWMYREDYARAGYLIFPITRQDGFLAWVTLGSTFALFVGSLVAVAGYGGGIIEYAATALLGSWLIYYATRVVIAPSGAAARDLLKATIVYLPLTF